MKLKYLNFLIGLLLVCFGVFLGFIFCNYHYFIFEQKIALESLLELFATLIFGFYISVTLQKISVINNGEKSLLIDFLKSLLVSVESVHNSLNTNTFEFEASKKGFKDINEQLTLFYSVLKESHCKKIDLIIIGDSYRKLRRLVLDQSPTNGYITLDAITLGKAKVEIAILKKEIYKVIFKINKD